ncbi:hypothetical protein PUN28_020713 [Cardiocondyla obscurior]|uniref:Uncharacterized protein n=1 Tax=Cardiocondyla obscurior TaxID=286306 RepID=A0AAW2EAS3_9HYME
MRPNTPASTTSLSHPRGPHLQRARRDLSAPNPLVLLLLRDNSLAEGEERFLLHLSLRDGFDDSREGEVLTYRRSKSGPLLYKRRALGQSVVGRVPAIVALPTLGSATPTYAAQVVTERTMSGDHLCRLKGQSPPNHDAVHPLLKVWTDGADNSKTMGAGNPHRHFTLRLLNTGQRLLRGKSSAQIGAPYTGGLTLTPAEPRARLPSQQGACPG